MKHKRSWKAKAAAGSSLALMASLLMPATGLRADDLVPSLQMARQLNEAFVAAVESVTASVVVIDVAHRPEFNQAMRDHPFFDDLSPEDRRRLEERYKQRLEEEARREPRFMGRGSGIIIRKNGYILTNAHVVDGAEKIRVRLKNGREFTPTGYWTDPQSDVAVIKIDATDLPAARLGDSSKTRVGEFAIAIGAPHDLEYSVTFGHVSAKGRAQIIPSMGRNSLGASMDQDFIQTDASINPGNSGGPLVNIEGEVIGINTLVRDDRTRIGFAVPVNLARTVAEDLIAEGKYVRPWLGVAVEPLRSSDLRQMVDGLEQGLVVAYVDPDGPTIDSGLRAADIITAVDGSPVSTVQQLRDATRAKKAGSELTLDVVRDRKSMQLTVRSAPWPDVFGAVASTQPVTRKSDETPESLDEKPQEIGLKVQAWSEKLAEKFGINNAKGAEKTPGVIVTEVKPDSLAARKGLRPGDLITAINHKPIAGAKDFREALKEASPGKGVIVNYIRDGAPAYKVLKDSGD